MQDEYDFDQDELMFPLGEKVLMPSQLPHDDPIINEKQARLLAFPKCPPKTGRTIRMQKAGLEWLRLNIPGFKE